MPPRGLTKRGINRHQATGTLRELCLPACTAWQPSETHRRWWRGVGVSSTWRWSSAIASNQRARRSWASDLQATSNIERCCGIARLVRRGEDREMSLENHRAVKVLPLSCAALSRPAAEKCGKLCAETKISKCLSVKCRRNKKCKMNPVKVIAVIFFAVAHGASLYHRATCA